MAWSARASTRQTPSPATWHVALAVRCVQCAASATNRGWLFVCDDRPGLHAGTDDCRFSRACVDSAAGSGKASMGDAYGCLSPAPNCARSIRGPCAVQECTADSRYYRGRDRWCADGARRPYTACSAEDCKKSVRSCAAPWDHAVALVASCAAMVAPCTLAP